MKLLPDNRTKYALSKQQLDKENKRALKILGTGASLLVGGGVVQTAKLLKKGLGTISKTWKGRAKTSST